MTKCYECGKEIEVTPLTVTVKDSRENIIGYVHTKCFNKIIKVKKEDA